MGRGGNVRPFHLPRHVRPGWPRCSRRRPGGHRPEPPRRKDHQSGQGARDPACRRPCQRDRSPAPHNWSGHAGWPVQQHPRDCRDSPRLSRASRRVRLAAGFPGRLRRNVHHRSGPHCRHDPGSNIGAATPVSGTGEEISETLADKATNDAAALIRAIAEERGRNPDALEETVRSAASYSASEALEADIIDLIADDIPALLVALDGRTVVTIAGEHTLELTGVEVRELKMQWRERFVDFISNPNIAFLLLTLGSIGLIIEMLTPGAIGPGVAGIICLGLGFLALGNLPFNWAGVAFILLAIVLAALEIFVSGFGALGIGAAVSLVVGGLLLFGDFGGGRITPPSFPTVSVNRWVLVGVGGVLLSVAGYLAYEVIMSRTGRRRGAGRGESAGSDGRSSPGSLVGQTGVVTSALQPRGVVALADETWSSVSNDGLHIPAGHRVRVVAVSGLLLTVEVEAGPAAIEGQE